MDGAEPEDLDAPGHVMRPDGTTNLHYDFFCFTSSLGVTIQCIVVSPVEDRYLVAFPSQVWHRTIAKRVLPQSMLIKPTAVEVACAPLSDMAALDEEIVMKIWVGYITAEHYTELKIMDDEQTADYVFKVGSSTDFVPYGESLVQALQEHFAFLSAESEVHGVGGSGSGDLTGRVAQLEVTMGKMAENINLVLQKVSSDKGQQVRFAADPVMIPKAKGKPLQDVRTEKYPLLDAAVVSAALAAGVSEENLDEMQKMMSTGAAKAKKMREPALRGRAKTVDASVLSESEEEEPPQAESGSPSPVAPGSMEDALSKLTELVSLLAADKVKRAKASRVELALEGLSSSSTTDVTSTSSVKRASAARRALRLALVEAPEEISGIVEKLIMEDLLLQTVAPGVPKTTFNARAWIEHRSRVGSHKTSAHLAWGVAGLLDDLVQGRVAHARARAGLMLVQIDQMCIDKGSWTLAAEISLEQGPPFASLGNHSLPVIADGESPFSRILDSRWSEVMLAHLKDAEDYVQKRRNLGKKFTNEESLQDAGRPKAKPKPKAKGSAHNESKADA